jgi:hypothetical protein
MEVIMVVYLGKAVGALVLALGVAALGAVATTDAYSVGARTEASSYKVINHMIGSPSGLLCLNGDGQGEQAVQQ